MLNIRMKDENTSWQEWYGFSMETAKVIVECGRDISNIEL